MPLNAHGKKMLRSFVSQYGEKEGTANFYATLNKNPAMKKKVEGKASYTKKVNSMKGGW